MTKVTSLAKKIAAGMAGSFPGVFLFQLISAPLFGLILLAIFAHVYSVSIKSLPN